MTAFQSLAAAYPASIGAGDIARGCKVPPNAMSTHLAVMRRAGLVHVERAGRQMNYRADLDGIRAVVMYLAKECSDDQGAVCASLDADIAPDRRFRTTGRKASMRAGQAKPAKKRRGGNNREGGETTLAVTIYHNPDCGTSRNTLAMILQSGEEPIIIEYLKTPPTRERLLQLIGAMGISVRDLLREKGTPYGELDLGNPKWTDDELINFMLTRPILINRPVVETPKGTRLCRPSETVLEILPNPDIGYFQKEDGQVVVPKGVRRA